MGDAADMVLDGYLDEMGTYCEYYEEPIRSKQARKISKELRTLIMEKQAVCTTENEKNHAVNMARQEINSKYGKGWRER